MAKTKAQKRAAQRKRLANRVSAMAPVPTRGVRPGRPPAQHDVGPTQQTVDKQKPETLHALHEARDANGKRLLEREHVRAGEEVLTAWMIHTPARLRIGANDGGAGDGDSEYLERVWRPWCAELMRRCFVRPALIVQWIHPILFGELTVGCDRDPRGQAGIVRRALDLWIKVGSDNRRAAA